ncbi:MAG: hypothetical protein P8Y42_22030 [Exilibacterium sp.]
MNLIEEPLVKKGVMPDLHVGSGNFQFNSQRSGEKAPITVFYHMPKKYTPDTKILLVVPGAGRNAWDYRDSWVDLSEKYNVLVVSPSYSEEAYDYAAYHLAGIVTGIEFKNYTVSKVNGRINKYHVADKDVITGEVTPPNAWLFRDFDDIFNQVVHLANSNRQNYDVFGHSAGGQILHRMAIFYTESKADRIIASNSGSYTLPSFESEYPFGVKGTTLQKKSFTKVFSQNLTVLVGEQDNDTEKRGTMLHTSSLDRQGLGRLSRGKTFYNESRRSANEFGSELEWGFCMVEGVGHDHRKMGQAAARRLYDGQKCTTKMSIWPRSALLHSAYYIGVRREEISKV